MGKLNYYDQHFVKQTTYILYMHIAYASTMIIHLEVVAMTRSL